jgi:hypothetical protein
MAGGLNLKKPPMPSLAYANPSNFNPSNSQQSKAVTASRGFRNQSQHPYSSGMTAAPNGFGTPLMIASTKL